MLNPLFHNFPVLNPKQIHYLITLDSLLTFHSCKDSLFEVSFDYISHFIWFLKLFPSCYSLQIVQTCLPCPGFLAVVISDPLDMSHKYFPSSLSILCVTSQGHEHPGSCSSLLETAMAVQSRVCLEYKKDDMILIRWFTRSFILQ